jgi:hypothetical protein
MTGIAFDFGVAGVVIILAISTWWRKGGRP